MLIFIYSEKSTNIKDMAYDLLSAAEKIRFGQIKIDLCRDIVLERFKRQFIVCFGIGR